MSNGKETAKITVLGSNMVDLVTYMERLPRKGETLVGKDFEIGFGGKGANQAVAASRLGSEVTMVTKVGDDMFGPRVLDNLEENGINTDFVDVAEGEKNGVAPIFVNEEGDNWIYIIPGANYRVDERSVDEAMEKISDSDLLVLQLEIPAETVYYALKRSKEVGTPAILNPAPARKLDLERLSGLFFLVPNEVELEALTNSSVDSIEDIKKAAGELVSRGIRNVVVTLGEEGSLLVDEKGAETFKPSSVEPVDTTGAGDAFIGSLATFRGEGLALRESVAKANRYAAASTESRGTQKSYLRRDNFSSREKQI